MSIKTKLALFIGLFFGGLLCVAAVLLIQTGEGRLRESIIAQNTALVRTLTYSFDRQLRDRQKILADVAAKVTPVMATHPAQLQEFLQVQTVLPTEFSNVLFYAPDGTVLAAWPGPENYVGSKRMVGMEYLVHTVRDRKPYISQLFKSPVSGQPLIVMTAPVLDETGKVLAVLGGSQYILRDNLFSSFTGTNIGGSGSLFLIARDRTIIAHSDPSRLMKPIAPGTSPGVDAALTQGSYAGETATSRGVPSLITMETMRSTGWLVGLSLPLSDAYAPIVAMRTQGLFSLAALLLILPLFVRWIAGSVTRPIVLLRDHIQAMAETAQPHSLVDLARSDEIGELARAFEALMQVRHTVENELTFLAHHDPLTKLPNRLLLRDRFAQAASAADRNETRVALLFLDLDNFKEVNDSLGHGVGDRLLVGVVQRLQLALRQVDTISREGGDEFAVLVGGVRSTSDIGQVAQTILDAMTLPFEIEHHTLYASCSIGISVYPNDGGDFNTVLKNADTALYRAKDGGRRGYCFFAGHMDAEAQKRMQMQKDLRQALKNQEFELFYQPQVSLRGGDIVGVEALIRWRRGDELVPPSDFIPMAETNGLILPISEWVIGEACRQGAEWRRQGLGELRIAVNLSLVQFKQSNIYDTVRLALERSGLPPASLELELTETILLQDVDTTMNILQNLGTLGVRLAIDDFGTGYSSLSYLKRLAVNKLKIDRSFVSDVVQDSDAAAIAKAILQLGHTLQLEVTAEGVETTEQCDFLKACDCDEVQGFLFSKPIPALDIPDTLNHWAKK